MESLWCKHPSLVHSDRKGGFNGYKTIPLGAGEWEISMQNAPCIAYLLFRLVFYGGVGCEVASSIVLWCCHQWVKQQIAPGVDLWDLQPNINLIFLQAAGRAWLPNNARLCPAQLARLQLRWAHLAGDKWSLARTSRCQVAWDVLSHAE